MGAYIPPYNGNPSDSNRPFINAAPEIGVEGSIPDAYMWELWQRELINVILAGNIVPNKDIQTQVRDAIFAMIDARIVGPGSAAKLNPKLFTIKARRGPTAPSVLLTNQYQTWALNSPEENQIEGATFDPGTKYVSLPAGAYRIFFAGTAYSAGANQIRLFDRTNNVQLDDGLLVDSFNGTSTTNNSGTSVSFGFKRVVFIGTTLISIDHVDRYPNATYPPKFGDDTGVDRLDAILRIEREAGQA